MFLCMLMTILALMTAAVSLFYVFSGLRMIAMDTAQTVSSVAQRTKSAGQIPARAAFVLLWVMIFILSYM